MLSCCYLSFPGRFLDGRGLLPLLKRRKASAWGSHGGTMGSLASLELWGTGLISGLAQGLRIWHCCSCSTGCSYGVGSIPGPGTSPSCRMQPKKKKKIPQVTVIQLRIPGGFRFANQQPYQGGISNNLSQVYRCGGVWGGGSGTN